jgi:hypothetical protein
MPRRWGAKSTNRRKTYGVAGKDHERERYACCGALGRVGADHECEEQRAALARRRQRARQYEERQMRSKEDRNV